MSLEKLLVTLREKAEADIRQAREDAETKAGELERQNSEAIRRLRTDHEQRLQAVLGDEETAHLAVARQKGKELRLRAEEELAARLYKTALGLLSELRRDDYSRTFAALAAELPRGVWQVVTTNPADVEAAQALFKDAAIVADDRVSGGLRVESPDGLMDVDNSLAKRLQTAWPRLLPNLIRELRPRAE